MPAKPMIRKARPRKTAPKRQRKAPHRPEFVPTDEQRTLVKVMVAGEIKQEDIAAVLRIAKGTLRKHFRKEIATAIAELNGKVVGSLYKQALAGDVKAAIWITQSRMGWKQTIHTEHSGSIDTVSDEELDARIAKRLGKKGTG